jgi:hypothetical protein
VLLSLDTVPCDVRVESSSGLTGAGLDSGFTWLADTVARRSVTTVYQRSVGSALQLGTYRRQRTACAAAGAQCMRNGRRAVHAQWCCVVTRS